MKKLIFSIMLIFLLTGCYNYRELNDLAIVSAISIAKVNNEYELTIEVVNPKKQQDTSSSKETDFVIYKNNGDTLQEVFRRFVNESPKKLYGAQMGLLIMDESLAKEDLKDIVDFLSRDPEIRSEFYVIIGKNNDLLEITAPLEKINSKNILNSLEANAKYLGSANLVTFHDLISNYLNDKIDLAIPTIKMIGNIEEGEETSNLENTYVKAYNVIDNISVFKDNKLIGYLEEEDSKIYNLVRNNLKTTLVKTKFNNDEYIVNEIVNIKSKIDVNTKKRSISIKINGDAAISEANYIGDLTKDKTIEKIEKKLNNYIEKTVEKSIKTTIEKYNNDIYGFEDMFYKKDASYYKKHLKNNWEEVLKNLEIKVKSNIDIFEKGNLNGGLYHD